MKIIEIINNTENINQLLQMELPVKVSYRINRIVNKLSPEIKIFNYSVSKLLQKYGKEDTERKGNYTIKKENVEAFNKEFEEIGNTEIKLDFEKIKVEDLGDVTIKPKLLVDWMFDANTNL
jgi:hypothetical protein